MAPQLEKSNKPKPIAPVSAWGLGKEKDFFLENLSLMLDANMPLTAALASLQDETQNLRLKKIIGQVKDDILSGAHLWQAFEKTGILPEYSLSLIKIGEESGRLAENLRVISQQQQKDRLLRSRIRSAMIYPVLVLSVMLIVGTGISWFILPRLSTVFLNLRLKLPLPTRVLMAFGQFLQHSGFYAIPLFFGALALVFYFVFVFPPTKFFGQKILFVLPGVKTLIQEVEMTRFGYMLGSLLGSGIPVVEAVGFLSQVATFHNYKKFYLKLQLSLEEGNSFKKSFQNFPSARKLIPVHFQQIIAASEQSGKLQESFLKISSTFEEKSEESTKNLAVILEPLLLVIVWVGVVGVALSVVLPLYQLVGGLQSAETAPPPAKKVLTAPVKKIAPPVLQVASSTPAVAGPAGSLKISVAARPYLNVRSSPDAAAKAAGKARAGETYKFISQSGDWLEIVLPSGQTGWINKKYAEVLP